MLVGLFGVPHVETESGRCHNLPDKAFVAIALMVAKFGNCARRSEVAGWLWENTVTSSANTSLRQVLASIRKMEKRIGTQILRADRRYLYLSDRVIGDWAKFAKTSVICCPIELANYIAEYRHEFLQGFDDVAGEELKNWILLARQQCANMVLQVIKDSAEKIGGRAGIAALQDLLELYPFDESLLRSLLLAHFQFGASEQVGAIFRTFSQHLGRELGESPSSETLNFVAQLKPEMIPELEREHCFVSKVTLVLDNQSSSEGSQHLQAEPDVPRLMIVPPSNHGIRFNTPESFVASGIVEDITLSLCRTQNFIVIAPHTARQFVVSSNLQAHFAVDYIVSTHVTHRGGVASLGVRLTKVRTGVVIATLERKFDTSDNQANWFAVVQALTAKIGLNIDQDVMTGFEVGGAASAYIHYLFGRKGLAENTLSSIRRARRALIRSLEIAPQFHPAKLLLARSFHQEWFLLGRMDKEPLRTSLKISDGVVGIDGNDPGGYWERSTAYLYLGELELAEESVRNAAERAPNHADITAQHSDVLCHLGNHVEAEEKIETALKLNPLPPDLYYWIKAGNKFLLGKYQSALEAISKAKVLPPSNLRLVSACHAMMGDQEQANHFRGLHMDEYPDFRVDDWASLIPGKIQADKEHYIQAIRLAGFQ